jgi:hypothetical protein
MHGDYGRGRQNATKRTKETAAAALRPFRAGDRRPAPSRPTPVYLIELLTARGGDVGRRGRRSRSDRIVLQVTNLGISDPRPGHVLS